jgi:2-polyprenyl-3-methyl-5-hydroxy-6-metoxy-1,4-benzoquinol methylase
MKCRICANTDNNTPYKVREMMAGLREEFTYFQCGQCRCLQITATPDDMSTYYSENYYSFQESESPNFIRRYLKRKRNEHAVGVAGTSIIGKFMYGKYPRPDLRSLSHLALHENTRLLDVGCGRGELLRILHQMGFKHLMGIDPYNKKEEITIDGNVKIYQKNIHDLSGEWDCIMMHHVFEHMPHPGRVLESASRLLAPGGQCLIRIPLVPSAAWEKYREHWVQLDPPRHFFVHSPQSMEHLIRDTNFELTDTVYDSTAFQFWGSIQYENDIPLRHETSHAVNPEKSMFTSDEMASFAKKAKVLNAEEKGDQAAFILRKK